MKKQIIKVIVIVSIILFLFTGIIIYKKLDNSKTIISSNEKQPYTLVLQEDNCESEIQDDITIIKKYNGIADILVINNDMLNGNKLEINPEAFLECGNLEKILIEKTIVNNNLKIENFKINNQSTDEKYIEYKNTQNISETYKKYLNMSDEEKNELTVIPDKYDIPIKAMMTQDIIQTYGLNQIEEKNIPESFNLRDKINIKTENQGDTGTCYAFASLTAVETNLALKNNDYVDLSEGHLASKIPLNTREGFISADNIYYKEKIGPIYDNGWIVENNDETAKRYVERTINIPTLNKSFTYSQEEIDTIRKLIKTHIMNYGSLYASISSTIKKNDDNIYVLNAKFSDFQDHAVSIIGWDDNFSKENFPVSNRPTTDGAYLALNSWGNSWADNGCFWISYEDNWVEANLKGVISVDTCQENMNIENVSIKDENDTEMSYKITKGAKAKIEVDLNINEVINNNNQIEISIISPNRENITNGVQILENKIENNKAKVYIDLNTSILEKGEYLIKLKYEDEIMVVPVIIKIDEFDFEIKENGNIKITGYYGKDKKLIIPRELFGCLVTSIDNRAFINNDLQSITIYENIVETGENIIDKSVIIYGNEGTYVEQYANTNGYIFIEINNKIIEGQGWRFESENQKLYILENSSIKEYDYLKKVINKVEVTTTVNEIFSNQFEKYENLEEVILPDSITSIGEKAFSECYNLKTINLPQNITQIKQQTFYSCQKLENINIPENVTIIGMGAFHSCANLKNIEIPTKVTTISEYAFYECVNLQTISMKEGLKNIGGYAFFRCINLEYIDIPESVTSIGDYVFYECENLDYLKIPSSKTTIGTDCFKGCVLNEIVEVGNTEIELFDIIKRATTNGDILNCNSKINVTNGSLDINQNKLNITPGYGEIIIKISDGKLKGLTISIIVSGEIEYNTNEWTNEEVTATLYIGKGEYVVNNGGDVVYKFSENGEFEFEYININGENKKVIAKVENIDKTLPEISIIENKNEQKIIESITATISDEQAGLWSSTSIGYAWSQSNTEEPNDRNDVNISKFADGTKQISFDIDVTGLSGKYYLWIYKNAFYDMAANGFEKKWELISTEPYCLGEALLELESDKFNIQEQYILNIEPNTTVEELKEQLQTNANYINIYNENNELQEDTGKLATGMRLELKTSIQEKTFTLVVKGDVNGDGKITVRDDIIKINAHRLSGKVLSGEYLMAADANGDGEIKIKDIILINALRLNQ